MFNLKKGGIVFMGIVLGLFLMQAAIPLNAGNGSKGTIIGFVYDKDGTTPLQGAVVKIKNIGSGSMFESTKSDKFGIFRIADVEKGVYAYGVSTPTGDFNSDTLMGVRIKENETAKVSIALDAYPKNVSSTMKDVYIEQKANGESLVGKVIDCKDDGMADVYVIKGYLENDQKIHTRGEATNFYQEVRGLKKEGASAKRLYAGETATLKMREKAQPGDLVYLVCKKGVLPMFMAPLGVAAIIGGSAAIVTDKDPDDHKPDQVSPFK